MSDPLTLVVNGKVFISIDVLISTLSIHPDTEQILAILIEGLQKIKKAAL